MLSRAWIVAILAFNIKVLWTVFSFVSFPELGCSHDDPLYKSIAGRLERWNEEEVLRFDICTLFDLFLGFFFL